MRLRNTLFRRVVLLAAGCVAILGPTPANAETLQLDNPRLDGVAVDRCLAFNTDCDWAAANTFCARTGYTRADDWAWAWMARTRTLGSGEDCVNAPGTQCGGFISITCAGGAEPPGAGLGNTVTSGGDPATTGAAPPANGLPAPAGPTATFSGTISDYAYGTDPATGSWIVRDIRPGAPDGTVLLDPTTEFVRFTDTTILGPGGGPPGLPALAPPMVSATGMTQQDMEGAFAATGFTPLTQGGEEAAGSGDILARIEQGPHDCFQTGPSNDRLHTKCALVFSLTNTSSELMLWSSGEWETPSAVRPGMDRRSVGYGAASFEPGEKITLKSFCIVPTGQATGSWAAWGSARYPGDTEPDKFTWRLSTYCP